MVDRVRREFRSEDIEKIAGAYHRWRNKDHDEAYEDVLGFCKSASLEEVSEHGYVLTPGRYVGAADTEVDGTPFEDKLEALRLNLTSQFAQSRGLEERVLAALNGL